MLATPRLVSDVLIQLTQISPLWMSIDERKVGRHRWIRDCFPQSVDPGGECHDSERGINNGIFVHTATRTPKGNLYIKFYGDMQAVNQHHDGFLSFVKELRIHANDE